MVKIVNPEHKQGAPYDQDEAPESDFKPLTAEQAQSWRRSNPAVSPWRVVGLQAVTGGLLALAVGLLSGRGPLGLSVAYGALSVVLPAALFARGLQRQQAVGRAGAVLAGFFVWEMVKILLTVAMLFAAPKLILQLNWLALLGGFVVTMKVYWVAVWLRPVRSKLL